MGEQTEEKTDESGPMGRPSGVASAAAGISANEERARSQVLAMIRQAQGLRGELSEAAQRSKAGTASNDLSTAAASVAQAQQALEAAAAGGNVPEQTVAELEAMLSSIERMAENAVQSAAGAEAREGSSAAARELAAVTAETRQVVQDVSRDMFEKKIFDPYLHFNSPEEEREYREREAQRKEEIERLQREGSPEATRRALQVEKEQLHDAGSHGATAIGFVFEAERGSSAPVEHMAAVPGVAGRVRSGDGDDL